jgi:tetratricopeptide (TPR) repeat protein
MLICASGCGTATDRDVAIGYYIQGQAMVEQGQLEAALAELAKAAKADPTLAIVHTAAGDIHRRRGNFELAAQAYESACRLNPYAFRPHYNLGVTYQMLAAAARSFERVQELLVRAVDVYLRAVTIQPADFDSNLNISACYFQLGKFEQAEQYCRAAIAANGKSAQAYSNMGTIYDAQNRPYDAIRAYKTSLELNTHQPVVILNLGSTYMRQGRLKAALHTFSLAAKEDGSSPAPWEQMGVCHVRRQDYDKALESFRKALAMNPNSAVACRGMGVALMSQWLMDQKNTRLRDEALEAWNRSLELEPNQPLLVRLVRKYTPQQTGPQL